MNNSRLCCYHLKTEVLCGWPGTAMSYNLSEIHYFQRKSFIFDLRKNLTLENFSMNCGKFLISTTIFRLIAFAGKGHHSFLSADSYIFY